MITDWDAAYDNLAHVHNAQDYIDGWVRDAAAFRASHANAEYDLAYGAAPRNLMDIFHADDPVGLVVYVHGGYWKKYDKSYWSHLAAGALARGWSVAVVQYTLAPEVRIAQITTEIAAAIDFAAGRVAGPIRLIGHSAGGHLVARINCDGVPLSAWDRVVNSVSLSGVHELHPLMKTAMNEELRITKEEADTESPAMLRPRHDAKITAWVGADELPEFVRQTDFLVQTWGHLASVVKAVEPDRHHFSVLEGLQTADTPLMDALMRDAEALVG